MSRQKAIIFGISGQDGYYLSKHLLQQKIEVTGVSRSGGNWIQGSVANFELVDSLIKTTKPDYIFHLAANSATRHELLFEHLQTISTGTLNILESAYRHAGGTKIFIAGSGLQFINTGAPIKETHEFSAMDVYSVARIHAVYAARYFRNKGLRTYVGYLFHHDSPMRKENHLNQKIVNAVKAIEKGEESRLSISDVSVEKEYGFADDIAEGILHLVQKDEVFEACIGTGKAYTIQKWLELCFTSINKDWMDFVDTNKDFVPEFKRLVSDPGTMNKSGWQSKTGIEELAKIMLHYSP